MSVFVQTQKTFLVGVARRTNGQYETKTDENSGLLDFAEVPFWLW